MEDMDFIKVKEAYNNLITEYVRLLNHVNKRRTNKILRAQVESHIRGKLQELSQSFAILMIAPDRITDEFSDWLKLASDDCDRLAGKLISMREFLSPLLKVLSALYIFFLSLILLDAYDIPTSPGEAVLKPEPLLDWLANWGNENLFVFLGLNAFAFLAVFVWQYAKKIQLFSDPQFPSQNNQEPSQNIYLLENVLFSLLHRDKILEINLVRIFGAISYSIIGLLMGIGMIAIDNVKAAIIVTAGFLIAIILSLFNKRSQDWR